MENSYKEVMENSSVTLKCNVTGVPLPYIIWKDRSGQVLESSGNVSGCDFRRGLSSVN